MCFGWNTHTWTGALKCCAYLAIFREGENDRRETERERERDVVAHTCSHIKWPAMLAASEHLSSHTWFSTLNLSFHPQRDDTCKRAAHCAQHRFSPAAAARSRRICPSSSFLCVVVLMQHTNTHKTHSHHHHHMKCNVPCWKCAVGLITLNWFSLSLSLLLARSLAYSRSLSQLINNSGSLSSHPAFHRHFGIARLWKKRERWEAQQQQHTALHSCFCYFRQSCL